MQVMDEEYRLWLEEAEEIQKRLAALDGMLDTLDEPVESKLQPPTALDNITEENDDHKSPIDE